VMYAMSGLECEAFADGYVEGIAWACVAFEDDSRDGGLEDVELPSDVEETLRQDARDFLSDEHTERLVRAAVRRLPGYSFESAGIDYALTRNGHGAGYWDRGLGMLGEALTQLARPYGSRMLGVALDGTIQAWE
jgi:hypothetical protein